MLKKISLLAVFILLLLIIYFGREKFFKLRYDATHRNPTVVSAKQIDSIFATLEVVKFTDIPQSVLQQTHSLDPTYKIKLSTRVYYKLNRNDLFKKAVKDYRLKDFISKDALYLKTVYSNKHYYTCLDKRVLQKFLELLITLENNNYNVNEVKLRSAHRHPKRNYYIGGASQSRHIFGEAIDIGIGDIDRDGKTTSEDKEIVLEILEKKIIGNDGGIGVYPGTKAVHFDVRGHRARWNTYTPAIKKKN